MFLDLFDLLPFGREPYGVVALQRDSYYKIHGELRPP